MGYDENIYYNPEKHGLTVIGELHDPNADYSFNDIVVWEQKVSGRIYYAEDSGCSCPSPFQDYIAIADLTLLTTENWGDFVSEVRNHAAEWDESSDEFRCDKNQMLTKVNAFLRPPTRKELNDAIAGLKQIAESLPVR